MQLTESWRKAFPPDILTRYEFAETRNAAMLLQAVEPGAFQDLVDVLSDYWLYFDALTTPGRSKSVTAKDLDEAFRRRGWREAQYNQVLTTSLTVFRWAGSDTPERTETITYPPNQYGGHKVDNVLGRAALDVEWNPKDGNLDRDLGNYVSLYEAGVIDAGVIVTRIEGDLRVLVRDLIAKAQAVDVPEEYTAWHRRMSNIASDPLGTSTTSHFGKLVPRIERGDGRGCPILAIAYTDRCYRPPAVSIDEEVLRIASALNNERDFL